MSTAGHEALQHRWPHTEPLHHILIVDDETRDGWSWAAALRRAGFRVGIAQDIYAGWHALDCDTYSLLITNQAGPAGTDWDVIQKARTISDRLPCVLIREPTAPNCAEVVQRLQPGIALPRPVTIATLLATVRELLRADETSPTETITQSSNAASPVGT